jgi:hypothetical protein
MSKADQFRQYAEEAMRWACKSKTPKETQALIELARTWTLAAVSSQPRLRQQAAASQPVRRARNGPPTIGIACCAETTARGHAAAAPPSSVMNSRRFIQPFVGAGE